jgi:hypothetical protein
MDGGYLNNVPVGQMVELLPQGEEMHTLVYTLLHRALAPR